MAGLAVRVCASLALIAMASAIPITKLPMNGTVAVTGYKQGGAMQPPPAAPCTDVHFGSCPVLQASEDSLSVSYKFPAASVKPGSYVSLTACYTNFSTYDRPWRKPNAMDFRKSKDCPYKFATKLPAPSGNATWHVPEKIPDSTIFIRAWLWTEQADGTFKQTNYGRTKGNWQIQKINDIPNSMKGAVVACCLFSPIMVGCLMAYEKYVKKTI
ncbi:hypothetical protein CVIRNUC_008722 [Coccomyxa viridis]|uniref:Uncharacterized protein n=1 Tax=Coccomyxa viridis TaxID=1274662 RepID=A0AAV1IFR0_9CHLO|nr:hypothetical protein CVIRNUC_008722 [Coccomyxa viridis]